ncbi:FKBP-type peptidyl-prolyl cis-trans isomerase [Microbacterium sediminicola]|uniref:Peptidyl-prolyl cis-trans isomerase n=1 Tax=Microbacterium sediminicola TaxID=415210 RepID=A0ABN2HM30_9MICO
MRSRPLAALSIAAAAALLLAGCTSSDGTDASADAAGTSTDLCAAAAPSGAASEAITVEGAVGEVPTTVSFTTPVEVTETERTVAVEGDGTALTQSAYVSYALTVYDGSTGEQLESAGYGEDVLPAIPVEVGSGIDEFFGCATAGSRIVLAVPGTSGYATEIYAIDVLEVTPADEWCQVVDASGEMPTVTFDDSGVPTITIPDAEAPAGVVVQVLEEGDGATVESGDSVTVNYSGVAWSDGLVFDSSWENGATATFTTTQVVSGFQRALEGQKVGSTVLVTMAPECGYGVASTSNTNSLAGETLVFVVEIISDETQG